MRSTRRWRLSAWARALGALPFVIACAADRRGGQSGTEGDGGFVCGDPTEIDRTLALDEVLPWLRLSPNDLAAEVGPVALPGKWLATNQLNDLSIELGPLTSAREIGTQCSRRLVLQSVTIRTSDGVLDLQAPVLTYGEYQEPSSGMVMMHVALPRLPEALLGPALWEPDVAWARQWLQFAPTGDTPTSLVIQAHNWEPGVGVMAAVFHENEIVGVWHWAPGAIPPGPPAPYTPDAALASACSNAEDFRSNGPSFTRFETAAAALEGVTGTWARCIDHTEYDHDGLRILPDGTWHHVQLEGGELVARHGLGHEGSIALKDDALGNQLPGIFQLTIRGGPGSTNASERALVFDAPFEGWPDVVYLPTTLPVRSESTEYADGERAGAAACERTEHGIVPTFEETAAALTGEYVLCSGSLPGGVARIRFEDPIVELTRQDGSSIAALSYRWSSSVSTSMMAADDWQEVYGINAPYSLAVGENEQYRPWSVTASRRPRKLQITESRDSSHETAVFSALP